MDEGEFEDEDGNKNENEDWDEDEDEIDNPVPAYLEHAQPILSISAALLVALRAGVSTLKSTFTLSKYFHTFKIL